MSIAIKLSHPLKAPSNLQQMTSNDAGSGAGDGLYNSLHNHHLLFRSNERNSARGQEQQV